MAAASDPATTAITANSTAVTAAQRGTLFPTNHDTAGSSPRARKKATPIKMSIDDAAARPRSATYVTATPADAVRPTKNGECQLNRRPGGPTGCSGVLSCAATSSASASGPPSVSRTPRVKLLAAAVLSSVVLLIAS